MIEAINLIDALVLNEVKRLGPCKGVCYIDLDHIIKYSRSKAINIREEEIAIAIYRYVTSIDIFRDKYNKKFSERGFNIEPVIDSQGNFKVFIVKLEIADMSSFMGRLSEKNLFSYVTYLFGASLFSYGILGYIAFKEESKALLIMSFISLIFVIISAFFVISKIKRVSKIINYYL